MMNELLDEVAWNEQGLVPAIAQDYRTGTVLMMAWMNREALQKTIELNEAVYWSRSRQKLWHKGESSGHVQQVHELSIDCDADAVLLKVHQAGGIACHTGRAHCFFRRLTGKGWQNSEPVLKDPSEIYAKQP
jgi:phosphoribosyl-AMP cyclohydrolase